MGAFWGHDLQRAYTEGYTSSFQLGSHAMPICFNTRLICKVSDIPFFQEFKSDPSLFILWGKID